MPGRGGREGREEEAGSRRELGRPREGALHRRDLRKAAGEFDFQARHIDMPNHPVLVENQEQGGYRVLTWPTFGGSDAILMFNQTYQNNPAIGELLRNRDFRMAMSYAIDREKIKELAFLGLGEARQGVPAPNHPYYPGDEWAYKYTKYDSIKANEMLDSIGMTQRDADGFRTLPNGEPLDLEIGVVPAFTNWPDVAQIVVENWANVGIKAHVEVRQCLDGSWKVYYQDQVIAKRVPGQLGDGAVGIKA